MKKVQNFLYNSLLGRLLLKLLVQPPVSRVCGYILNTKISSLYISRFIKSNNIDITEFENRHFTSFNDFFTRKLLPCKRPFDESAEAFISPCDSALTVYKINTDSSFKIKNSDYTLSELTKCDCEDYAEGLCLVFRLAVNNYHRYCYIDNGTKTENRHIKGVLHTVMPVSADHKVFVRNSRDITLLHTENFGDILQIEVGAMLVGKISNHHEKYSFSKGEEKGLFEFGGSTIVLLTKKDAVSIRQDIIDNSMAGLETDVLYGETIGLKIH